MTIVVAGDDAAFEQMGKQIYKLVDVIKVIDHTRDNLVGRELALIKIRAKDATERAEIMQIANVFRANLVDISADTVMVEVTGKSDKLDAIQRMLEKFEMLVLVRTGVIVLMRGT
jgi:acetolactate synthase-1/3 small subunit